MLTSANLAMSARIRNLSLLWRRGLNYRNGSKDALKILFFFFGRFLLYYFDHDIIQLSYNTKIIKSQIKWIATKI